MKFKQLAAGQIYAIFLNIIMPGLGHFFWKESLFGIFVFLVTLIASVLFFISFFISLPFWAGVLLFGIPIIFYFFTFVDLNKTIKNKKKQKILPRISALLFLIIGLAYQIAVPITPTNFFLRNLPEFFIQSNNEISPVYNNGDLLRSNNLAYLTNLFFLDRPFLHTLPERYDIIRFVDSTGSKHSGIVVGLPAEDIAIIDGVVIVNGIPDLDSPSENFNLAGECDLTSSDVNSIIVATLNFGAIDKVHLVPLQNLKGKVNKLF